MTIEPLAAVCELAFDVAKEGVDSQPPIDPPAPMRSYLYIAQLPVRAFTVSQRVLEEDPDFRRRVAERATEENVGRAGVLWLTRPEGWETEYSRLMSSSAGSRSSLDRTFGATPPPMPSPPVVTEAPAPSAVIPPIPDPPRPAASGPASSSPSSPSPAPPAATPSFSGRAPAASPVAETGAARSSIEDELSNLRDLVDRLADERRNVRSSVIDLEAEVQTRRVETTQMSTQLQTLQSHLDSARQAESSLQQERDRALARIADLEAERDQVKSDLETSQASAESTEAERVRVAAERDVLAGERDQLLASQQSLRTDNEVLTSRLDVAEQARVDLEAQLDVVSSKWQTLSLELEELAQQRGELSRQILGLAEEREAMSSAQRELFTEIGGQLGRVEAERDALAERLDATLRHLGETRVAFDTANRSVSDELDRAAELVTDSVERANALSTDLSAASGSLLRLENIAPVSVELPDPETIPATADADEGDKSAAETEPFAPEPAADAAEPSAVEAETATNDAEPEADPFSVPGADTAPSSETTSQDDDDAFAAGLLDDPTPTEAPFSDSPVPSFGDAFGSSTMPDTSAIETGFADSVLVDALGAHDIVHGRELPDAAAPLSLDEALAGYGMGADDLNAVGDARTLAPRTLQSEALQAEALQPVQPRTSTTRTPITVPNELMDDELGAARFLTMVDDVVLVIDGDVAAELGWPTLPVPERRGALGWNLDELTAEAGAATHVVFDPSVAGADALPTSDVARIELSDETLTNAAHFSTVIDGYPSEFPIVVVTDDPNVAASVRRLGASVLSSGQLLDLFLNPDE